MSRCSGRCSWRAISRPLGTTRTDGFPRKAALAHRDCVAEVVRRCVDWKTCRREDVLAMAARAGIPMDERDAVVAYAERESNGLYEGHAIRYGVAPASLIGLPRKR